MKNTLENWYSQNKLTTKQYYQLVDLVNSQENYTLSELILLADLPSTDTLPNPNNSDDLARFKFQRDIWDYEDNLKFWLDDEPTSLLLIPHWLRNVIIIALLILLICLLFN